MGCASLRASFRRWNPKVWPFKWKLLNSTFLRCWFSAICSAKKIYRLSLCEWNVSIRPLQWKLTKYIPAVLFHFLCCTSGSDFEFADEILNCSISHESYWAELCYGVVYAAKGGSDSNLKTQNMQAGLVCGVFSFWFLSLFVCFHFFQIDDIKIAVQRNILEKLVRV